MSTTQASYVQSLPIGEVLRGIESWAVMRAFPELTTIPRDEIEGWVIAYRCEIIRRCREDVYCAGTVL